MIRSAQRICEMRWVMMKVVRPAFLLHRLINDALRAAGIELVARGEHEVEDLVEPAREKGRDEHKGWRRRVAPDDYPINIEAAAFLQLIAYFIEGRPFSLGLALGLLVLMAGRFPTRAGVARWAAAQQARIDEERRNLP